MPLAEGVDGWAMLVVAVVFWPGLDPDVPEVLAMREMGGGRDLERVS